MFLVSESHVRFCLLKLENSYTGNELVNGSSGLDLRTEKCDFIPQTDLSVGVLTVLVKGPW